jgi:hypothetical protein
VSNQKYAQFMSLLATGRLNWLTDTIQAVLVKDAAFDVNDKVLSDVGQAIKTVPVTGRAVVGQAFIGDPVFFPDVAGEQAFQVVIVQNRGTSNPNVIAWYDTTSDNDTISVANPGTLVVRPAPLVVDEGSDAPGPNDMSRVWMAV